MILVDIYIPSMDQTVDFNLDEDVPVSSLAEEIGEMIAQSSQSMGVEHSAGLLLCSVDRQCILDGSRTLRENGVRNGSRLLIV